MAGSARRALINALIWSLCIAAFVAIVALLSDSDGEGTARVAGTFLALAVYSSTSLVAVNPALGRRAGPLAVVILGISLAGMLAAALAIWDPNEDEGLQRLAWGLAVAAVSVAHVGLIVARAREDDPQAIRLGEAFAAAAVLVLAFLAIRAIASDIDDEAYFRAIGVVAIADAYGTFVIPLVRLLRARERGIRRGFLLGLVCVLTVAAAGGITGLVRNSVDEDLTRLLATLPFVALSGAMALAGSGARRRAGLELLGGLTILASALALAAVLNLIWIAEFTFDGGNEGDLEWAWTLLVTAGTLAHVSVLLARRRPGDGPMTGRLVSWAVVAACAAGVLMVYPVLADDAGSDYAVWLAITLILDVLATALVALVRKRDSATA